MDEQTVDDGLPDAPSLEVELRKMALDVRIMRTYVGWLLAITLVTFACAIVFGMMALDTNSSSGF